MLASVLPVLALVTSLGIAGPAAADTPGVPTSTVDTFGEKTAHYCVSDYGPNATVAVRNEKTGDTASISTNHRGSGCTDVPVAIDCGHQVVQTIVASGVAADGNPGTSSARAVVPGNVAPCDPASPTSAPADASSSLSGVAIGLIAGGGAGVLALAAIGVILVRRRRSATAG